MTADEMMAAAIMLIEYGLFDEDSQKNGIIQLEDPRGMTFAKMWKMPFKLMKAAVKVMETSFPVNPVRS